MALKLDALSHDVLHRVAPRPIRRVSGTFTRIPARLHLPLAAVGLSLLLSLLWWAAFYPGLMSYDSFTYTWESTTGHWINDHSIPYDACVWLTLELTGSYAMLTFCQILVTTLAVGYLMAGLRKLGIRRRWLLAAVVLFGAFPPTGDFAVFVWKDVPFVLGGVLSTGAVVHLVSDALRRPARARRSTPGRRRDQLMFSGGLLLLCLARNNGFLTVLLTGLLLVACLPWQWRRIAPLTAAPILCSFVLTGVVYPALGVRQPPVNSAYTFFYADVAVAYSKHPTLFDRQQLRTMAAVAPLRQWAHAGRTCWNTDVLTAKPFDKAAAAAHHSTLLSAFATVLTRDPQDVLAPQLCRGHNAWAVFPDHGITVAWPDFAHPRQAAFLTHPDLRESRFAGAFWTHPLSGALHHLALASYHLLYRRSVFWLAWGGAVWCYLTYALVTRLSVRGRRREILAVAVLTAALQLTVLAATPAPLYRYMAGPTALGVLLLPLAFARPPIAGPHRPHEAAASSSP